MTNCGGSGDLSRRRSPINRLASSKESESVAINRAISRLCLGVDCNVSFSRLVRSEAEAQLVHYPGEPREIGQNRTRGAPGFGQNAYGSRSEPAVARRALWLALTLGAR